VLGPAVHAWSVHEEVIPVEEKAHGAGGMIRVAHLFPPPLSGPDVTAVPIVAAEALWLDRYRRADVQADVRLELGPLILRPRAGAGWGEALPVAALFALGGPHGFPGMRIGERRGDRFAFASLAVLRRVRGPLYARVEVGRGRTTLVDARHAELVSGAAQGSVDGGELGLMTDTPLGALLLGYGVASSGRPVIRVRLGG
jgi:hypothetical protein